jgi:hypothetical protein
MKARFATQNKKLITKYYSTNILSRDKWLYTGFGLVIGFIKHLEIVTTSIFFIFFLFGGVGLNPH